jgi:putative ABC transport system permease protein
MMLKSIWRDLRYGVRILGKNPGFTALAIAILAFGIGANTAIFSVVNSVLLKPLAYREPQQLYLLRESVPQMAKFYPTLAVNIPDFRIWQKECRSFESIAIAESASVILSGKGDAQQLHGVRASANLFDLLGVQPELGRGFIADEDEPGRGQVVVLTAAFWRSHFQADKSLLGKTIKLDGAPFQVVGILPDSFHFPKQVGQLVGFPEHPDFFQPLNGELPYEKDLIGEFDFAAIARLKPGVDRGAALAELNVVQAQIAKQANEGVDLAAAMAPLESEVVGPARRGLLFLLFAVGTVLLIVCTNLANLLLARVPGRMREAAIRISLGASPIQLLRQLLIESLLLGAVGGALGIWLASLGVPWLLRVAPADLPRLDEVHVDGRVLLFGLILSLATAVLFGVLPAWRIAYANAQETLKAGSTSTTESHRTRRFREALIGLEVGLCAVLLIVAGLLASSLRQVLNVNAGFTPERVLAADVDLPPQSYDKPDVRLRFYDQSVTGIRALPGIVSASWVSILPLEGQGSVTGVSLPGAEETGGKSPIANYRVVGPDYFKTMGIPLGAGREFTESDRTRHVVIVSQGLADRFWPNQNPIGKICVTAWGPPQNSEVVGVAGDIRTVSLDESPLLMVYTPGRFAGATLDGPQSASIVVRTATDPSGAAPAVRSVIRKIDSEVPIVALRPMSLLVAKSVSTRRFQMSLALIFALSALLLASLGIFGVVAYSVEQRRHELGIRKALGAPDSWLRNMVLRQGMMPVFLGLAGGIVAAFFAGRLIGSLLFGVNPFDVQITMTVAFVIVAIALVGCWIPARRATRIDPMVALRYE